MAAARKSSPQSTSVDTKKCNECRKTKPLDDFARNGSGRRATCNTCRSRARRADTANRRREQLKELPSYNDAKTALERSKRYVVTWAQNATKIHQAFFTNLLTFCEANEAQLVVIPGRYRNPTSLWSRQAADDDWWDTDLEPYMYRGERRVHGQLTIFGDTSIQPTASKPLTGMEVYVGNRSAIFGHPKLQLQTVSTATRAARLMCTTGAITLANYTPTKAGKKAEAHHVIGATIVECGKDSRVHVRQINATTDGSFIDLAWRYSEEGVTEAPRALSLILGDVHADRVDPGVMRATFGLPGASKTAVASREASIVELLQPRRLVFHDVLDFGVRNHHSIGNARIRTSQALGFMPDIVENEIERAIAFIDDNTPENAQPYVVCSNHDEAFDRWLAGRQPEDYGDYKNARFFHEVKANLGRVHENTGEWRRAFQLMYEERGKGRAQFLDRNEDLSVHNVHLGFHGDKGPNGSRGSAHAYAKLGVKTVIGHSHSPQIMDGTVVVGTSSLLDMGYNALPSSWAHAHCVQYANGKRSLLFIDRGEWRLED